jgi:hypothetical protein
MPSFWNAFLLECLPSGRHSDLRTGTTNRTPLLPPTNKGVLRAAYVVSGLTGTAGYQPGMNLKSYQLLETETKETGQVKRKTGKIFRLV